MLQPKRTKYRKAFKGRIHGAAKGGTALNFGSHGLKAVEPERVTARQIEAARRAITRHMKRAGRVRQAAGQSALASIATVAATSFVATSIFALSGLLLQDESVTVSDALWVIPVNVAYDVLLTPFVLPVMMKLFRRTQPHEVAYR